MAAPREPPTPGVHAPPRGFGAARLVVVIRGPIGRAQIQALCELVRALLERCDAGLVEYDVRALDSDAVTVDALARLALTARRLGRQVRLSHASCELQDLVALMGLDEVCRCTRTRRAPGDVRPL